MSDSTYAINREFELLWYVVYVIPPCLLMSALNLPHRIVSYYVLLYRVVQLILLWIQVMCRRHNCTGTQAACSASLTSSVSIICCTALDFHKMSEMLRCRLSTWLSVRNMKVTNLSLSLLNPCFIFICNSFYASYYYYCYCYLFLF